MSPALAVNGVFVSSAIVDAAYVCHKPIGEDGRYNILHITPNKLEMSARLFVTERLESSTGISVGCGHGRQVDGQLSHAYS